MFRQFSNKSNFNQFNLNLKNKVNQGSQFSQGKGNFNQNSFNYKSFFGKFSKKNFMQGGGNPIANLLPLTRALVIGNITMYGLSFLYSKRDYTTNFLYNIRSIEKGKILTPITSHFSKNNTIDFAIDTLITALIGNNIESTLGTQLMQRMVLLSGLGALVITHLTCKQDEFIHPETIVRFIIYFLTVQNPNLQIFLFPLPFQVKIMYVAGIVAFFDLIQNKMYNFSPLMVCMLMKQKGGF
jgi:membrane associated rhomboid family serine protease